MQLFCKFILWCSLFSLFLARCNKLSETNTLLVTEEYLNNNSDLINNSKKISSVINSTESENDINNDEAEEPDFILEDGENKLHSTLVTQFNKKREISLETSTDNIPVISSEILAEGGSAIELNNELFNSEALQNDTLLKELIKDNNNIIETAATVPNQLDEKHNGNTSQDEMPSFIEWAKKKEEEEKNKGENLTSGNIVPSVPVGNSQIIKSVSSSKNYASGDCGSKVIAANPESTSSWAVISPSRDEYFLNPCTAKIWFIVELCEPIQLQKIELANFELFSSSPKEFSIEISDRYPTRDWTLAGKIEAEDSRTLQTFSLTHLPQFIKYVRIELQSHYGQEHFCPISLFRAFGISEYEVLENVDEVTNSNDVLEENELENDSSTLNNKTNEDGSIKKDDKPKNFFGTAKEAVMSIVKRAAEALVVKSGINGTCQVANGSSAPCTDDVANLNDSLTTHCITPGYIIVCVNCTDSFFYKVYHLLCCQQPQLRLLLSTYFISETLSNSAICTSFGLNIPYTDNSKELKRLSFSKSTKTCIAKPALTPAANYLKAVLPGETIAALCNMLAVSNKKLVLNTSVPFVKSNELNDDNKTEKLNLKNDVISVSIDINNNVDPIPSFNQIGTKSDNVATINPTKTIKIEKILSNEFNDTENNFVISENENFIEDGALDNENVISNEELHTNVYLDKTIVESENDFKEDMTDTIADIIEKNTQIPTQIPMPPLLHEEISLDNDTLKLSETNDSSINMEGNGSLASLESLDSLFSELDDVPIDLASRATVAPQQLVVHRETVFVRLANKIKMLEKNSSLSSQYLEQLSQRYKKDLEELQKSLAGVQTEMKNSLEREQKLVAQVGNLNLKIDKLTVALEELLADKNSWFRISSLYQHMILIIIEVSLFGILILFCRWLNSDSKQSVNNGEDNSKINSVRRKSVEHNINKSKSIKNPRRRPSDEACKSAGISNNNLLISNNNNNNNKRKTLRMEKNERRRKRRKKELNKNKENVVDEIASDIVPLFKNYADINDVLESNESSNINVGDNTESTNKILNNGNGAVPVSSPSFFRTAFSMRKRRISLKESTATINSNMDSSRLSESSNSSTVKSPKKQSGFRRFVKKFF